MLLSKLSFVDESSWLWFEYSPMRMDWSWTTKFAKSLYHREKKLLYGFAWM